MIITIFNIFLFSESYLKNKITNTVTIYLCTPHRLETGWWRWWRWCCNKVMRQLLYCIVLFMALSLYPSPPSPPLSAPSSLRHCSVPATAALYRIKQWNRSSGQGIFLLYVRFNCEGSPLSAKLFRVSK